MFRKTGIIILGMLVLVGGLVALRRSGATVQRDIPEASASVSEEEESEPVVSVKQQESESSAVAVAETVQAEAAPEAVNTHEKIDDRTLDPSVREVLTGDNYNERLRAVVYTMPETLSDSEYLALQNYLLTTQDGRDGDFRQHEYALRNYIMDALREEQTRLYETIDTFTDIYSNEAQGEVMRNYALQHLASAYIDNVSGLSANDKSRIVTTLQAAINGKQSLPGTALVGLQDISRWDPATLSPSRVGNIAMDILSDRDANKLSRISAFQISGELKLNGVSSYARDVAFDEKADRALRMSAIYALGQLGQTTGLDSLLNDANKYVSNAAQAALNVKR